MGFRDTFESFRQDAQLRVAQTNVVSRHLRRIFTATKELSHSTLAGRDLELLGIKLSELKLEGACSDDHQSFYRPLPKSDLPKIDWDEVQFLKWHEGYSVEPRRVDQTLQSVSNAVWSAWLEEDKEQIWVQRK